MLLMTLHRAMESGLLDDYYLKGGAAIEVRHGFGARATQDVDLELPVPLDVIVPVFAAAIAVGCDDFTFELRGDARPVREDAVTVTVAMKYLGRAWGSIEVDLAPAQPGDVADTLPLASVEFPDLHGRVRTMRTEFQIAQKIHAITMPEPAGYPLKYARHVVDLLYLAGTGVDPATLAAACQGVFDARSAKDGRTWPPDAIILPERWIADFRRERSHAASCCVPRAMPGALVGGDSALLRMTRAALTSASSSWPHATQWNRVSFRFSFAT
jgi:hypothetical protein